MTEKKRSHDGTRMDPRKRADGMEPSPPPEEVPEHPEPFSEELDPTRLHEFSPESEDDGGDEGARRGPARQPAPGERPRA